MSTQSEHDRGEKDASEGRNEPPHTIGDRLADIVTFQIFTGRPVVGLTPEEREAEKDAYQSGRDNYESQTSDCCYITSACLDDLGIPRTTREMTAMKTLTRDHVLRTFSGKRDYIKYERIAPGVVRAIRGSRDVRRVWTGVHETLRGVADLVDSGKYEEGHQMYKTLVLGLEAQFVR